MWLCMSSCRVQSIEKRHRWTWNTGPERQKRTRFIYQEWHASPLSFWLSNVLPTHAVHFMSVHNVFKGCGSGEANQWLAMFHCMFFQSSSCVTRHTPTFSLGFPSLWMGSWQQPVHRDLLIRLQWTEAGSAEGPAVFLHTFQILFTPCK